MLRLLCVAALVISGLAHAAPPPDDTIDAPPQDRSLKGQWVQVRQTVGDKASHLVENAMGFLGAPYRRGGNSADTGFDCSGFVRAMYENTVGTLLPRRASEQAAATQIIDKSQLKPGDLVFFNTMRQAFSHVGIYVGDNKFIHSPKPGAQVRVEDMRVAYWERRFTGARRVASEAGAGQVGNNSLSGNNVPAALLQAPPNADTREMPKR
jgi:NlpC/P60 family